MYISVLVMFYFYMFQFSSVIVSSSAHNIRAVASCLEVVNKVGTGGNVLISCRVLFPGMYDDPI